MNLKHIWSLTKTELKHTKYHLLILSSMATVITLLLLSSISMSLKQGDPSLDPLFLFLFATLPLIVWRPNAFKYQKLQEGIWGTPILMMLQQLPIPKKSIHMYRFVYYLLVIMPCQLLILFALFIFSPTIQQLLTVSEYAVFIFMWISIGTLFHWGHTYYELGTIQSVASWIERIFMIIIFLILFFGLFYGVYDHGLLHWTVFMATTYPVLSIIISLLFTIVGVGILKKLIERKMAEFDYY